jgi:3-hydroxyacyl-CoA dehydrogenase
MTPASSSDAQHNVTLIGLGTIGISFAALHIKHTSANVSVYDTRPDLEEYINSVLPGYIDSEDAALSLSQLRLTRRLKICSSLEEACQNATIVQEQGPENLSNDLSGPK